MKVERLRYPRQDSAFRLRGHRVKTARLPYRSGRSHDWLKMKNPAAPAVKREAEEDWGRQKKPRTSRPGALSRSEERAAQQLIGLLAKTLRSIALSSTWAASDVCLSSADFITIIARI